MFEGFPPKEQSKSFRLALIGPDYGKRNDTL